MQNKAQRKQHSTHQQKNNSAQFFLGIDVYETISKTF